ncbi:MAG: putative FMN/FAD exporter YeeO [Myxococcota bacterium]|nr:putative FMN/FAD exporter YeeO [Myxococcota bacterium]
MNSAVSSAPSAILHGSLGRAIVFLAGPAVLSMGLRSAQMILDTWLVGHLGRDPQAAQTSGVFILWMLISMVQMISTGAAAVVARRAGEGDISSSAHTARQSIRLALAFSALYALLILTGGPWMLRQMGISGAPHAIAVDYTRVMALAVPGISLSYTTEAVFRASGDTRTPMKLLIAACLTFILVSPVLVLGVGGFGGFGLPGSGLSLLIGHAVWGFGGWWLLRRQGMLGGSGGGAWLDWALTRKIISVGAPAAASGMAFSLIYVLLARIATRFGDASVAALGIGHRMESLNYLTATGFALAATTLVGQNLGARQPDRADRAAWLTTGIVTSYILPVSLIMLIFAGDIAARFNTDPAVAQAAASYIRIAAWSQVCMGFEIIMGGAFEGAGDTVPPMIIQGVFGLLRVPLAGWMGFDNYLGLPGLGMGLDGLWWAISLTTIARGLILAAWWSRGKWRERKL